MNALPRPVKTTPARNLGPLTANLAILGLWLWLFRPIYSYLGTIFTRQEFRANQIVLLGAIVLIVLQARRGSIRPALPGLPQPYPPALALALLGAAAFAGAERWLDINTLSATLFGLATYGLLGLWMQPVAWRRGLPAALLLVGVLPFGDHLETFVGYPLRLVTARMVSQGLSALGVPNLGVDTILVFENGVSQVDSPCSGVKSLWTGALFFLAATWIDRRPVNRRWLLAGAAFVLLLLAANALRVALLILVGQAAGWRLLAEMLHVPLGVIGFTAACAAGVGLLRWSAGAGSAAQPGAALPAPGQVRAEPAPAVNRLAGGQPALAAPRSAWLTPVLILALIGLALLVSPGPQAASAASIGWRLPAQLETEPWPLTKSDLKWITSDGALPVSGGRWRFQWQGLQGSLLMTASDTWRAHHRPERCFTVYGLEVQDSRLALLEPDFPLRMLTLGAAGSQDELYTAGYWLQSREQITDDYSVRIWDDLAPQPQRWVLVTVLFDRPENLSSPEAVALFSALRQSVQQALDD